MISTSRLAVAGKKMTVKDMKEIQGGLPDIQPAGSWLCFAEGYDRRCHTYLRDCERNCPLAVYCSPYLCFN